MVNHNKKFVLPFLETMITQVCNLSCQGCTNYSDLTHSGYVTWAQGQESLLAWLDRIDILDFGIMGGEPMINPEFREWLIGVRKLLPDAQIRFTTNGLLLHRHPDVIDLMHDLGNVSFKITVHYTTAELEQQIQHVFEKYQWQPVREHGIDRWKTSNNFRFHVKRPNTFVMTHRNNYENMAPWHNEPAQAFEACIQQTCPLLYNGAIYKCSTAGLLLDTLARFNFPNFEQWKPYIPRALVPTDSDQLLAEFVSNFGKPNDICAQCPTPTQGLIQHCITETKS